MKSIVTIKFVKINGIPVNESLLKNNPTLKGLTKKTSEILCEQIKKYFKDSKIEVETNLEMK